MGGMLVTVVVVEVLGSALLMAGATFDGDDRVDWIRAMSVSLVPMAGSPRHKQYRCS